MASNALSVDNWWSSHKEYYFDAFSEEYRRIWVGMQSIAEDPAELQSLSYFRALTCFLKSDEAAVTDRRRLLYAYLLPEFQNRTAEDTLNRYRKQLPVRSTVRRVIKNICTAYDEQPTRKFTAGESAADEIIDQTMAAIYEEMRVATQFQRIYHRARLTGMVLARPLYINGRWHVDYLTPDQFRLETDPDDVRTIISVTYPRATNDGGVEYVKWTNDFIMNIDMNGRTVQEQPNPYGRIPFVVCRLAEDDTVYTSGMLELVESQLGVNKLKFLSNLSAVFAGAPVWVATNFNSPNLTITPERILRVDGVRMAEGQDIPPTLEAVTPDASYRDMDEYAREQERTMQHDEGIPPSMTSTEAVTPPSGIARLVERNEILELRYSDQKALREFERAFAEMTALVAQTDVGTPVDAISLQVQFADESIIIEPDKEYTFDKQKLQDGVMTVQSFYQKWAGLEMDEDELVDELTKRRALAGSVITPEPAQTEASSGVTNFGIPQ